MLKCQRSLFQIPEEIAYLNCASQGPFAKNVEAIGIQALQKESKPFTITGKDYFDPVSLLRKSIAQLIQVQDPDRIAIIPSVSYGMGNVVQNVKVTAGKTHILLLGEQFPSNYYPWKNWADQHQIELRIIKAPQQSQDRAKIWNEQILKAINSETLAISLPNVHWTDGTLFDLNKIRAKTKSLGALLIVDASQSVGALPIDLDKLQPDALVCTGYKWLMGPYGLAFAYYGEYFDGGNPIEQSWINKKDSDNFAGLANYQMEYRDKARRYNVGEHAHFISVPILNASIQNLLQWEVPNIQNYCQNLIEKPVQELLDMGCQIEDAAYRAAHLFGIRLPKQVDIKAVLDHFQKLQIFVSQRGEVLRISPNVYNNERDFQQLIQGIKMAWR